MSKEQKVETKKTITVAPLKIDVTTEKRRLALAVKAAQPILSITSLKGLQDAISVLHQIKERARVIETAKRSILDPLNAARKATFAVFAPLEEEITVYEKSLKDSMSKFQADQPSDFPNKVEGSRGGYVMFSRGPKVLVIENEKKIPEKFWVLDEAAIKKALEAGEHVPGADLRDSEERNVAAY